MINQEQISLLFDALDCLESRASNDRIMAKMMVAMLSRSKEEYAKATSELKANQKASEDHMLKLKIAEVRVELSGLLESLDSEYLAKRDLIEGVDK